MTFSGQVALHSPHCTQASSAKRSIGRSVSAESAPVGQADTQARQSVQPSTLISTAPNGAPAGSGTTSTGAGAARCNSRSASRITSRLPPTGCEARRPRRRRQRGDGAQRLAERIRIVGLDGGDAAGAEAQARQDRLRQRDGLAQTGDVVARPGAQQEPHGARAIGECRRDRLQADLRHLVDRERQHMRRQAVAVPRQRVDQLGAVGLVMQQHDRVARRRPRDRPTAARAACASARRPAAARRPRRRSGRPRRTGRSRRRFSRRSRRDRRSA